MISICRTLCIFFMMAVHFGPGHSVNTILNSGTLAPLGAVWLDFLSRSSVATLSFVSGFLIAGSRRSLTGLLESKTVVLLLPLLVWNVIFVALQLGAVLAGVQPSRFLHDIFADPWAMLPLLTGLTGTTANESLFFLRDLFVSLLIVAAIRPLLARRDGALVCSAGVLLLVLTVDLAPLVFRPSILAFLVIGASCRFHGKGLHALAQAHTAIPLVACLAVAWAFIASLPDGQVLASGENLLRRSMLIVLTLLLARQLIKLPVRRLLKDCAGVAYVAYLGHAVLMGVIWAIWREMGGTALSPAYVFLVAGAPAAAFVAAFAVHRLCAFAPSFVQFALTGRVNRLQGKPSGAFA